MDDFDEEILFLVTVVKAEEEEKAKRKRKIWVHEKNVKRQSSFPQIY